MAQQDRKIAVATKEKERAESDTQQLAAPEPAGGGKPGVQDQIAVAEAERQKQTAIIAREAQVQETRIAARSAGGCRGVQGGHPGQSGAGRGGERASALHSGRSAEKRQHPQAEATKRWRWFRSRWSGSGRVRKCGGDVLTASSRRKLPTRGPRPAPVHPALIDAWKEAEIAGAALATPAAANIDDLWRPADPGDPQQVVCPGQQAGNFLGGLESSLPDGGEIGSSRAFFPRLDRPGQRQSHRYGEAVEIRESRIGR